MIGSSIGIADEGPLFATLRDKELGSSVAVTLRYIRILFSVLKKGGKGWLGVYGSFLWGYPKVVSGETTCYTLDRQTGVRHFLFGVQSACVARRSLSPAIVGKGVISFSTCTVVFLV